MLVVNVVVFYIGDGGSGVGSKRDGVMMVLLPLVHDCELCV